MASIKPRCSLHFTFIEVNGCTVSVPVSCSSGLGWDLTPLHQLLYWMSPLLPELASGMKVLSTTWSEGLDLLGWALLTACDRGMLNVKGVTISRNRDLLTFSRLRIRKSND